MPATISRPIKVGDRVRSFDFDNRNLSGPRSAYIEGQVVAIVRFEGCDRYKIAVEKQVFDGEVLHPTEWSGPWVFPPVNGTQSWMGLTDGVELLGEEVACLPLDANRWS